jgi:secreted trypsin-like serine protease
LQAYCGAEEMLHAGGIMHCRGLIAAVVLVATEPAIAAETCPGWRNPVATKIVGGDRATLTQWPSFATLRLSSPDGSDALFICGGTAITRDWVMTAAHCFDHIEQQAGGRFISTESSTDGWTLNVTLGSDDLANVAAANTFAIAERIVHEKYLREHAQDHGEDIALVRLARPWTGPVANLSIDPSTDPKVPPGAGLMVAGFGLIKGWPSGGNVVRYDRSDGGGFSAGSRHLLHVGLPLVATNDCAARWPDSRVAEGQICAGFDTGTTRRDSCNGDSGGPLNAYDSRGCPTQVGLVSWGADDCGLPNSYGVYTRISYHADWLRRRAPGLQASTAGHPATGNDLSATEFVTQARALIGSAGHAVTVAVNPGGPIKIDGQFTFAARSDIAGRLVIIDVNADGIATQIFPNQYVAREDLSLVQAGKTVTVPGPGYGFDYFRASPPLGKGRLITLVLPSDFSVQSFVTAPVRSKGFVPERSATGYFMNLLQQVRGLIATRSVGGASAPGLAIADTEYEIVR